MRRLIRRHLPLAALAILLAGVSPVLAQRSPSPNPGTGSSTAELCAPVGLALAVIGDTGVAAEAMGQGAALTSIGSRATARKLVAYAPAAVGACADFQGYWGDTASGKAFAKLTLFGDQNTDLGSDDASAAHAMGPVRATDSLKVLTKLADPGTYSFVALLEVTAVKAGSNTGARAGEAQDGLKVPFTVEVRERPQPQPRQPQEGFITGTVRNADAAAIEGARVNASPGVNAANPRRPGGGIQPIIPGVLDGVTGAIDPARPDSAVGGEDQNRPGSAAGGVLTGPDGTYRLALAPGKYLISAGADGFVSQWYDGAALPDGATRIEVKAGETTAGIDFKLSPKPVATISGVVKRATGDPAPNVMVIAALRDPANPTLAPNTRAAASAMTDRDGKYTLKVDPATYAVGAAQATSASRLGRILWWDAKTDPKDADLIELAADAVREGVDFTLP